MQTETNQNFLSKYVGTKSFYKEVMLIALPVMAHTFITSLSQLVDNIMVGRLSEVAISSVYITNQIFFIFQLIFFGISGASEIYISQYLGSKDDKNINKFFNLSILVSVITGILFLIFVNLNATRLISIFDTNPDVIHYGTMYLSLISLTFIPFGINMAFGFAFRAYHMPKIPMYIGGSTIIFNVILNYIFIFGVSTTFITIPAMGIVGAAYATIIARTIETLIYLTTSYFVKSPIKLNVRNFFKPELFTIKKFVSSAIPLVSNDFLWALSLTLSIVILSNDTLAFITGQYEPHIYSVTTNRLAAISISSTFFNLFFMLITGMGSATSILIGKSLGSNNLDKAKDDANKLVMFTLAVSIILSILFALSIYLVPVLYVVSPQVIRYTTYMILIMAATYSFNFLNSIFFYILRAGGDVKNVIILDSLFAWVVMLPVGFMLRYYFKADFMVVFAALYLTDGIKMLLGVYLYKKGKWLKNITE